MPSSAARAACLALWVSGSIAALAPTVVSIRSQGFF